MALPFWLRAQPPFRLDLTAWAVRRRPENKIDRWDGITYTRVLAVNGTAAKISVAQGPRSHSRLRVMVEGITLDTSTKAEIVSALDRLLGRNIDLGRFYSFASRDTRLSGLSERFRGLKPPRFPSVFEALVNGIACQQLSLAVGITLLNHLAEAYGRSFGPRGEKQYAFPGAEDLAAATGSDLRQLGFSSNKGRALIELATAIADGHRNVEQLTSAEDEKATARLMEIRGVGRWTAEYVLLRGFGRTNIFPGDDVGARNNLERWLRLRKALDYRGVTRTLAKWQPFAGLIYFHLLMDRLESSGYVRSSKPVGKTQRSLHGI